MRRVKKKSSLYSFLDAGGLLEKGSDEELKIARKNYWNEYKRTWRKQKRTQGKEFTVSFTKQELSLITDEAKRHKMSRTGYIKRTTLAYIDKRYVAPDEMAVKRISQLLAMNYNMLHQIVEENNVSSSIGEILINKISFLEREVLVHLYHAKTLEELIKEEVGKNPLIKDKILHLLTKSRLNDP